MSRTLLTSSLLLLATACGSKDPTGGGPPPPPPPPPPANLITIDGNNVGASGGLVFISQGGASVSDASVTVTANGVVATPISSGYAWELPTPLAPGATLTVVATRLGKTATATGILPAIPVFVAPEPNDPITIGTPFTVTWTAAANAHYYLVHLGYRVGSNGNSVGDSVAGNIRTVDVATAAIPAGASNPDIDIRAIGTETLSGDVAPASKLRLFAQTEVRNLTFTGP
ncbi:MAG: hypothetical protein ABI542_07295 [Gemmatimonadota bacterium]